MSSGIAKYLDLSGSCRSIICHSLRLRQIIDLRAIEKSVNLSCLQSQKSDEKGCGRKQHRTHINLFQCNHSRTLTQKNVIYRSPARVVGFAIDGSERYALMHSLPCLTEGNLSHAMLVGHGIPNLFRTGRQLFLTRLQSSLQGRRGTLQGGAYREHSKRGSSVEQPYLTRGENCKISENASACV